MYKPSVISIVTRLRGNIVMLSRVDSIYDLSLKLKEDDNDSRPDFCPALVVSHTRPTKVCRGHPPSDLHLYLKFDWHLQRTTGRLCGCKSLVLLKLYIYIYFF